MSVTSTDVADFTPTTERESWLKSGPVVSHLRPDALTALEERATVGVADASSLGLFGFATGTWMAATVMGGMLPGSAMGATAPVLLIFAGLAQFIAGLYAYRRENALAGTAFCCFGAFNVTVAVSLLLQAGGTVPATPPASLLLGFLLESFGFISLVLTIAAMRANLALVAVLGTLCIGYVLSGIPHLANAAGNEPGTVGVIGAWFLIVASLFAYYTGAALVVNSTWRRVVLPLGG